jgi:branched-chain amino acid transport system substrate-binding protein
VKAERNPSGPAPEPTPESRSRPGTAAVRAALESRSGKHSRTPLVAGIALGVVLAVVLAAGLYQALRTKGEEKPAGATAQVGAATPAPEASVFPAVPAPSNQGGLTDSEIVVGMAAPFTGPNKELGRSMKAGIELAFAAANEAGGVEGRKLRLVALDDGYDPARTGPVMKDLVEDRKVFAIVGNVGGATAAVAAPYSVGKKVVFLGALSGSPVLRRDPPDRYVFNFRPSYAEETAAAVHYLVEVRRLKPKEIAVFAQEDEFGEAGYAGAVEQLRHYRGVGDLVLRVGYKRNTADVTQAVARIRSESTPPKAIVMIATYHAAATFIQKIREAGLRPIFTNVSEVNGAALAEELLQIGGPSLTDSVIVTQAEPPPTSNATVVMRYRRALEKHTLGEKPGFVSLEGYVVGNILVEGLKRAGRHLDSEKLVDALDSIKGLDLGIGVPITFGQRERQTSHKVWGTILESSGTYRTIDLD